MPSTDGCLGAGSVDAQYGYGYGYGYGNGYGYGDGYGSVVIGSVGDHEAISTHPFGIVVVGCQMHTIAWWRKHLRAVARAEGIYIDDETVNDLLDKAERG